MKYINSILILTLLGIIHACNTQQKSLESQSLPNVILIYADDLGTRQPTTAVPDGLLPVAQEHRERLLEQVAEYDDEIMEKYLEGEEISAGELRRALREATLRGELVSAKTDGWCSSIARWNTSTYPCRTTGD